MTEPPLRSRQFAADPHPRFWWHRPAGRDYVPAIYRLLTDDEWALLAEWYEETRAGGHIGELNPPGMSLLLALIDGGALSRVLQIGHYYGYSALLMGFWLRAMGGERRLVSVDIDEQATAFTQRYVDRAGLADHVTLVLADAATEPGVERALVPFAGAMPELIFRDSTHDYATTRRELGLWVPRMAPHSLLLVNGTSTMSSRWDESGRGGPRKALRDFARRRRDIAYLNLNEPVGARGHEDPALTYGDGVGMALLQKR